MNIQLINRFDDLLPYREQWNVLLQQNETNTVFQLFEWHQAWWNVFGDRGELCTLLVFSDGRLAGIAPFMKIHYGMFGELIQFVGEGKSDYCDVIIPEQKADILASFFDFLFSKKLSWNTLHLNQIPEHSSTTAIVKDICTRIHRKFLEKLLIDCPTIVLKDEKHRKAILNKRTLRRRYNYFKKNGQLEYIEHSDSGDVLKQLNSFFNQHINRVNLKQDNSLFREQENRRFYVELVKHLFEKNWIHFSQLNFNNIPLAYHFGFIYNQKMIWYKPSFNSKYRKHSPGQVMLKYLIESASGKKLHEFDFTVGSETFKNRFANKVRKNVQLEVYNTNHTYVYSRLKRLIVRFLKIRSRYRRT